MRQKDRLRPRVAGDRLRVMWYISGKAWVSGHCLLPLVRPSSLQRHWDAAGLVRAALRPGLSPWRFALLLLGLLQLFSFNLELPQLTFLWIQLSLCTWTCVLWGAAEAYLLPFNQATSISSCLSPNLLLKCSFFTSSDGMNDFLIPKGWYIRRGYQRVTGKFCLTFLL